MDKELIVTSETGVTHGRGYVYLLQYHIVWVTKYRKSILTGDIAADTVMSLLFCATADSPAQVDSRSHGPHMGSDRSRCGNSPGKGGISVLHFFVTNDSPPPRL